METSLEEETALEARRAAALVELKASWSLRERAT